MSNQQPVFAFDIAKPFNSPHLDGLRACAILLVLFHHAWSFDVLSTQGRFISALFELGWLGVEIFFVLSGFLICSVLMQMKGQTNFFRTFYIRRIFRIFPLYYLCIAALIIAALLAESFTGRLPGPLADIHKIWVNIFYLTNVAMAFKGFDWAIFRPTWTLALEEQFYLIFPLAVAYLSVSKLWKLLVTIIFVSPLLRPLALYVTGSHDFASLFPLFRFDGFAFGALVAIAMRQNIFLSKQQFSVLLGGALAVSTWFIAFGHRSDYSFMFAGYTATYLTVALIVYSLARWPNKLHSPLAFAPMVWIGQLSYGLYLIHMLVRGVVDIAITPISNSMSYSLLRMALIVVFSIILAHFSYRWFEQPIRRYGYRLVSKKASLQ